MKPLLSYFPQHTGWFNYIEPELKSERMQHLSDFLIKESQSGKTIYPRADNIFKAFQLTHLSDVKVVVIGQDPYHGDGQAHGLSFSVPLGQKVPPSLHNIFKQLTQEYQQDVPTHGNLEAWAKQGVFLLNSVLTVQAGLAASHQKLGWEQFTDTVVKILNQQCENLVFLLWGAYAQKKGAVIDCHQHHVLTAPHPSPLSAHRGFLGCQHFTLANEYLSQHNKKTIDWYEPVSSVRKIIHIDMDAFFASVEQRDNAALKGKPIAVGRPPEKRGVVAACSYEARKFGIHSAMPSSTAKKLCPELIFVPPRFDAYQYVSEQIHIIFKKYTDMIEPLSLDEAYLDVTKAAEYSKLTATQIASQIKQEIKLSLGLTASAGVSYNKFLAKTASDMDKPDGLTVVTPNKSEALIAGLPIRKLYGVGKVTEKKMHDLGVFTGADLKKLTKERLCQHFPNMGIYYFNIARAIDEREVKTHRVRKSIGKETTFIHNECDKRTVWRVVQSLAEKIDHNMKKHGMFARTLTLKVKYADFTLNTRSQTYDDWLKNKQDILDKVPYLIKKTEVGRHPIRLIGIACSNLYNSEQIIELQNSQWSHQQLELLKDD